MQAVDPATRLKLRVLLVLHDLFPGASSVPLAVFSRLRHDVQIRTLAPATGNLVLQEEYRRLGPMNLFPPWPTSMPSRIARRVSVEKQRLEIAHFSPDLIYVNSVAALPLARAARIPRRPVLLHVHELGSYLEPLLESQPQLLREWPARYVAVSDAVRHYLVDRAGIEKERVTVVHAFLRDEFLSRTDATNSSSRASIPKLVVGGAGYPSWRKGMLLWLELAAAMRQLLPASWTIDFRWVGMVENAEAQAARFHAARLKVDDIVTFVPHTQTPRREFENFDLFAMTSWEDPCPLVVLENMALGKPVLCFAGSGGTPEEIGDTGVVVSAFRPDLMAAAAAELAIDPERRRRLGAAAHERVRSLFTASAQVPKLHQAMRVCAHTSDTRPESRPRWG